MISPHVPLLLVALLADVAASPRRAGMVAVGPGVFTPVYPPSPEEKEIRVELFWLDVLPVTNAEFLAFVEREPRWRRDSVSRLFADTGYLAQWKSPTSLGESARPDQPVVRVSWFAAKAYCEERGGRLPTEVEWELAAAADEKAKDARQDPAFRRRIMAWYARPTPSTLPRVGLQPANAWGVRDLHDLAWEWVLDFNSALVAEDARGSGGEDATRSCGGGAIAADEKEDYASFMRIAFRSALRADYTTRNLGFRCAMTPFEPEVSP